MARNQEGAGFNPASLKPHKVCVTTQTGSKDQFVTTEDCFENVAAKVQSPAGLVLVNQDGETIAFYPFDHLVKAVARELDVPTSGIIQAGNIVPFPGVH